MKGFILPLALSGVSKQLPNIIFSVALVRVTQDHVLFRGSLRIDDHAGIKPGFLILACDTHSAVLDSKLPMGLWDCMQPNFSLSSSLLLALLFQRWWFQKHSIIILYMLICNSICFQGTASHNLHPVTVGIEHGSRKQRWWWDFVAKSFTTLPVMRISSLGSGAQIALNTDNNIIINIFY